jgi:hypothetical protein
VRIPVRVVPLVAATTIVAVVVLLAGCTEDRSSEGSTTQGTQQPKPRLGGRVPEPRAPPRQPMNDLEEQVADSLSDRVARAGLRLDYLDCPPWNRVVPSAMTCRGYVDGLLAGVRVQVAAGHPDASVTFDARLTGGVVATQTLEEKLVGQGWTRPDCGEVAAYPAHVGSRIICLVHRASSVGYVAATVTGSSGAVTIASYRGSTAER